MNTDYDVPDFDNDAYVRDIEPSDDDWNDEPRNKVYKSEHDIHARILDPSTRSSYNIGKGVDPHTNTLKVGFVPSGFSEANNADLTSANLTVDSIPKNLDERYILAINTCLSNLKYMYENTHIDVRPSYNYLLLKRDLYNSMTKARGGKLMEYAFVKKSDQILTRTDIAKSQVQKKKTWTDNLFGVNRKEDDIQ